VTAAFWVWAALWTPFPVVGRLPDDGFVRLGGALHVHTTVSDGAGTPEQVISAAREVGLDFLVLTDHNRMGPGPLAKREQGLLVLQGTEISNHTGHLLGLGIRRPTFRYSGEARDALSDVRHLGGTAFVAHPMSPRHDLAWTSWELAGPWGLEIINGDSLWRQASWLRLLAVAAAYPANSPYALLTGLPPSRTALERWDDLLRDRDVPGVAGLDAHGRLFPEHEAVAQIPSYADSFRVLRNYVLVTSHGGDDPQQDADAVISALARGRSYMAVEALAPADGFYFHAARGGQRWQMGQTAPPSEELMLQAGGRLPRNAELALLRNGHVVATATDALEASAALPGSYRVEVRAPGWSTPWIVSNPIYVFDENQSAARAARAEWPGPTPAPVPTLILDDFEGASSRFALEFDETSAMNEDPSDGAGRDGGDAARLEFRLGDPGPEKQNVWCALVDRTHRDLSGQRGLVFDIRGDGTYRIWIAVWEEKPGADDVVDWWLASARTSPDWQRVAVPFEHLYPVETNADRELDLSRVRGLAFNIDPGVMAPGSAGTIWIDNLGAY
jgi:hypothetical protein